MALDPVTRAAFEQLYSNTFISVQFVPAVALRKRASVIPDLYRWLLQNNPPAGEVTAAQLPPPFSGSIAISRNRPQLAIEPGFATAVSPPTLRIVDRKARISYVTDGRPIELLLYAMYPFISLDSWLNQNKSAIRNKLKGSVFRCAWIFFISDRATDENALAKINAPS